MGDLLHVKILDFGLAKDTNEGSDTSLVLGTVQYMAPEQIEGKDLGPWTDLYAVGCIAYEFITGQRAFPGRESQPILRKKLDAEHDVLAQLGPDHGLPDFAAAFLQRALARHPARRFRSASEMRQAWGKLFDLPTASVAFSRDLSGLADSEEVARLKSAEQRLAEERRFLTAERQRIEREKKQLESDRARLQSERMGTPAVVEHAAHGDTQALRAGP